MPQNPNVNHLIELSFQDLNRLFVLAFENDVQRRSNKRYYLPNVEIKDYNVMIDVKIFFWSTGKKNKVTYENNIKIATGRGDDYMTACLLDFIYFENYYKIIAVDLSKQQALNADPKEFNKLVLWQT